MLRQSNAAAQVLATALVGVAAVSMIIRLRRAKESIVNSSICWPTRRSCLLATFYLPTCTRAGRSAAFHPCSTRQTCVVSKVTIERCHVVLRI